MRCSMYYNIKDHLGSTRQLGKTADGSYSSQQRRDYYPYGEETYSAGDETGYTFTGKEHHSGSIGLTYFGRRYYDPSLGRWLTPDPMHQGFSPYVYCGNNPILMVDPDGQFWWIAGIVIGAYISGALSEDHGNPTKWAWDSDTWTAVIAGGIAGGLTAGVIQYGLTPFNIHAYGFKVASVGGSNAGSGLVGAAGSSAARCNA
jgi:RHS repeat-associated protein